MNGFDVCCDLLNGNKKASAKTLDTIIAYLEQRKKADILGDGTFGVVFATSKMCNLSCKHCAVEAKYRTTSIRPKDATLSTEAIVQIMEKIDSYAEGTNQKIFFMFGGGEPTMREDFKELTQEAARIFGKPNIGFCTNGTFLPTDTILSLSQYVGLLEVSVDGFESYHNLWRSPNKQVKNPFTQAMDLVKVALQIEPSKVEVASVLTTQNKETLPEFAHFLRSRGLRNYSVHRPVPIGRMFKYKHLIPTKKDYLIFFAKMAEVALESGQMTIHLHHSLEGIYSALLLGRDIHISDNPMGNRRHSIGVDWGGSVHFDPWAIVPPFSSMSPGCLADPGIEMQQLWQSHGSILNLIADSRKANVRCRQCSFSCSGGMRIAAILEAVAQKSWPEDLLPSTLLAAISACDPACPLPLRH